MLYPFPSTYVLGAMCKHQNNLITQYIEQGFLYLAIPKYEPQFEYHGNNVSNLDIHTKRAGKASSIKIEMTHALTIKS